VANEPIEYRSHTHDKSTTPVQSKQPQTLTFLRPEHLAPIRNLNLRAKLIVEGTMAGLHKSPYHGFSAEFLEYRPYFPGESVRFMDWRKLARSDKTVVRLFEDETNLYANLLLDKSASMVYTSRSPMTKFDYAKTLCASIAWILIRQRDAVGLCAFDESVTVSLPPRSTNVQLKTIIGQVDQLQPANQTQCGDAIDWLAGRVHKRGLCIIISDLFDDPEKIIRGLRHLRFKRQDVMVLWLLDPMEREFAHQSTLRIRDLESGHTVTLDPAIAAESFRAGLAEHRRVLENACKELRIDLECIGTDEPFHRALLRVLQKRRRLS
jgi:uncharacterized protein (DUF58 family)